MNTLVSEISKRQKIIFYLLLYILSFDLVYIFGVSQLYGYYGVPLNINGTKMLISSIVIFLTILLLPTKMESVSSHLFFILYILSFLPTASYYWLNNKSTIYFLELSSCFALIELFLLAKVKTRIRIGIKKGSILLSWVLVLYIISTIGLIIYNGGIKTQLLNLKLASLLREENNISGFSGYLLNWCARSLMPLFLAYYMSIKKKSWAIFISILQVSLYFSYGNKTFLLSVLYLIIISYSLKGGWRFWKILPIAFFGLNVLALVFYLFHISNMPLFLFPFRTLALPSAGQYSYFEYFNIFDKLHFGGSFLGNLFGVRYNYSQSIGRVVSLYMSGRVSNANTGLFSYAYADFGYFGMILASLAMVVIFRIVDNSTTHIPKYLTVGAMSYQMVCLNDTNLMINLNTGGIIMSIIMLIILDSVYYENSRAKGLDTVAA